MFVLACVCSFSAFAQESSGAFSKGTSVINLGVGFGDLYWGGGYSSNFPVNPTLSFDHAITDKLGIGNIGVGGIVSYASSKYSDGVNTYKSSGILVGIRGTYHFILRSDKIDPYAGVMIGYVFTNNTLPAYSYSPYGFSAKSSGVVPGFFAGIHYYFQPAFGVYGEVGYDGFSIVNLGVAFRFGGHAPAAKK